MAIAHVTSFWSALISVFLKCLAALGFTTPNRKAPVRPVAARPVAAPAARTAAAPDAFVFPAPARRDRSLPPTMKQRIRAEAHGTSPSARSLLSAAGIEDRLTEVPAPSPENGSAPRGPRPAVLCG